MKAWKTTDLARLKAEYAHADSHQLAQSLGRSMSAVRVMASRLGLQKSRGVTTPEGLLERNIAQIHHSLEATKDQRYRAIHEKLVAMRGGA